MNGQDLSLLEAVRLAKETERKAADFYTDAIAKTSDPLGQKLLQQLADFEVHHSEYLATLEQSLRNGGDYIVYEGRDLALPVPGDRSAGNGKSAAETSRLSVMQIITVAIESEREAEKRYTALAGQITHSVGRAMFERLAAEENLHFRVLSKAYWSLNDFGEWIPAKPLPDNRPRGR